MGCSWGSQGDVGRKKVLLLGPCPFPTAPLPAELTWSPAGEPRDFRKPRFRTAGHPSTQTLHQVTKSRVSSTQKTDNCLSVQPEGAFCFQAGRARLYHEAKPSTCSPGPACSTHVHTSSGFCCYTEVSGNSSISSNALRVVLLLLLEESWILLKSALKQTNKHYFRNTAVCKVGNSMPHCTTQFAAA